MSEIEFSTLASYFPYLWTGILKSFFFFFLLLSPLAAFHLVVQTLIVRKTTDFLNVSVTLGTKVTDTTAQVRVKGSLLAFFCSLHCYSIFTCFNVLLKTKEIN